jgi:hypothetical protein
VPPGTPTEAFVLQAQSEGRRLAYGYPAVLLFDRQDDRKGELGPLFTRTGRRPTTTTVGTSNQSARCGCTPA